ncbi:Selenoprotein M [Armadillidium vulgare]|nr:Selenoprotein M [Armadillidium vulgare]
MIIYIRVSNMKILILLLATVCLINTEEATDKDVVKAVLEENKELCWMTTEQTPRGEEIHLRGYSILVSFYFIKLLIDLIQLSFSHNVSFKKSPGAPPELVLLNKSDEEIERIPLEKFSREECNELLLKKGFYKKQSEEEEVPEEFQNGPYVPREEL